MVQMGNDHDCTGPPASATHSAPRLSPTGKPNHRRNRPNGQPGSELIHDRALDIDHDHHTSALSGRHQFDSGNRAPADTHRDARAGKYLGQRVRNDGMASQDHAIGPP